jgi:hypothetical protein
VPSRSAANQPTSQFASRNSQTAFQQTRSFLPLWRPRDGRNEDFLNWREALANAKRDLGIDSDIPCPDISEVVERIPHYHSHGLITDDDRDIFAAYEGALENWTDLNETLYDIIRPSLVLAGDNLERDLRVLATHMNSAKDGCGIEAWAYKFADVSTVASQADLQAKLDVKLGEQASLSELEAHSTKLWSAWLLISGNDPSDFAKLESFYYRWLNSLPARPAGSHLASVRKWLAEKISERSTILHDVDYTIDVIVKYAASIGLADSHDGPTMGTINAMFGSSKNNCSFCKANACQANEWPNGTADCLSRWDCKIPITEIKSGDNGKAMVLGLREHHEANKDAKSLKGIQVDLEKCIAKVRAMKSSPPNQSSAQGAGAGKQVTPVFDFPGIPASDITDAGLLHKWLFDGTCGSSDAPIIQVIGADSALSASRLIKTDQRLVNWRKQLTAHRSSLSPSYTPFTVNAIGAGGNFASTLRILNQSLTADKPRKFSPLRDSVKALYRLIVQLASSASRMEARDVVCLLAGLHMARRVTGPWDISRLVMRLKLIIQAALIQAFYRSTAAIASLSVRGQLLTA